MTKKPFFYDRIDALKAYAGYCIYIIIIVYIFVVFLVDPALTVSALSWLQSQKAVSAYFTSK